MKKIRMTDDAGHFWDNGKLFKLKKWLRGPREEYLKGVHNAEYVEVNPAEYDARIEALTKVIASSPHVDLLDVIRDALYDMPLEQLDRVEKLVAQEQSKEVPQVETKRGERGTCVELRVGGKFACDLRM